MPQKEPQFTRGEKCLFTHLIVTFSLILLLLLIYFVHIYVVEHRSNQLFVITRRTNKGSIQPDSSHYPIGFVYLNKIPYRVMCNTILLREQWSVAPGHCASIRSDPDMADMLEYWRIKYKMKDGNFIELNIIKTIIHGQFNSMEFQNNIGLFHHENATLINPLVVLNNSFFTTTETRFHDEMFLINWDDIFNDKRQQGNLTAVYLLNNEKCTNYVSLVVDEKRDYEFCANPVDAVSTKLDDGAVFVVSTKIIGFVSWGDRRGKGTPFVIIDLSSFQLWLDNAMNF